MKAGDEFIVQQRYNRINNYATAPFDFDFDATYSAEGWDGIAWRADGFQVEADEDTEWTGIVNPTGRIMAHMVGDDRPFEFDPAELTVLDEDAYCPSCGQIGCGWH
jgi:hypothetical protein